MFYFKFLLFFTVFNLFAWAVKDLDLKCRDTQCTEIIGDCSVQGKYHRDSELKLVLKRGETVEIYGKDEKNNLYLGKVKGTEKIGLVPINFCLESSKKYKENELVSGSWLYNDESEGVSNSDPSKIGQMPTDANFNQSDNVTYSETSAIFKNESVTPVQKELNSNLQKNEGQQRPYEPKNEKKEAEDKIQVVNKQGGNKNQGTKNLRNKETSAGDSGEDGVTVENASSNEAEAAETVPPQDSDTLEKTNEKTQKPLVDELNLQPNPTHPAFYSSFLAKASDVGINNFMKNEHDKQASTGSSSPTTVHEKPANSVTASSAISLENGSNYVNAFGSTDSPTQTVAGFNQTDNTGYKNESQIEEGKEQNIDMVSTKHESSVTSSTSGDKNKSDATTSLPPSGSEYQASHAGAPLSPVHENQASSATPSSTSTSHENQASSSTASSPAGIENQTSSATPSSPAGNENQTSSATPLSPAANENQASSATPLSLAADENQASSGTPSSPSTSHENQTSSSTASSPPSDENQASSGTPSSPSTSHENLSSSSTASSPPSDENQASSGTPSLPTTAFENQSSSTFVSSHPANNLKVTDSNSEQHKNVDNLTENASIDTVSALSSIVTMPSQRNETMEEGISESNRNLSSVENVIQNSHTTVESKVNIEQSPSEDNRKTSEIESNTLSALSSDPGIVPKNPEFNYYQPSEVPILGNDMYTKEAKPSNLQLPANPMESTNEQNENDSHEIDVNDTAEEPSGSWYSSILSYMPAFDSLLTSSPNTYVYEKSEASETVSDKENYGAEHIQSYFVDEESCPVDNSWISIKMTSWLVFTSVVILIFSLGYYYMENSKRDIELVIKNNDLASELFILQKERSVLEERLLDAEYNANLKSGEVQKEVVESLQNEIEQIKEEKLKLVEREQSLVKKCVMLEANYAKLRQMLAENKQKGERSALIADIKKLKESSSSEITSLKEQLDVKSEEIKTLSVNLHKSNEAKLKLEDKLNTMMADEQRAIKNYQDSVAKLEQMIEESKRTVMKLEDEVGKLKKDCESLKIEKELAETALQKAHGLKSSESLSIWLDSRDIRISLATAENEIKELKQIKEDLERKQDSSSSKFEQLQNELQDLNEKYEKAEKDKIEALTKLQVLSDYFNEKETQLQEELGLKEALWLQKQSDDHTIYEQMRTLREENQTFKSQNETLRKEIIDQEASYKKLIASAEEKADGYWVSLRQAERRLKETQIEASQLRNRLTAIETSEHNLTDDKMMKGIDNGEMPPFGPTASPPFMMYPGEFIPPPPLIPVTPSRPPPLGRISSPPLGDFTPPLPIPFDLYPPSPPPPPLQHLHRPQPRESTRKQKESQSSNHSSESTSEKPQRRTKR